MERVRYRVQDEVKDTADAFYRAVSSRNLKAMDDLWAHVPYASVAGRSGALRQGWPQVRGYWEQRFQQAGSARVTVRLKSSICHAVGDVAWLSGTEIRMVTEGELTRQEVLRMTAVLERRGANWQLVSYHASEGVQTGEALAPAS